jgi:hypothetical protein
VSKSEPSVSNVYTPGSGAVNVNASSPATLPPQLPNRVLSTSTVVHRAVELRVEPLRGHRVAPLGVLLDEGAEAVHLGAGDLDAGSHGLPLVPGLPSLLREPKGSGARGERIR